MSVLLVKKKDLHGNTKVINLCLFSSSWFQFCIFIDKFSVKCFRHVTFFYFKFIVPNIWTLIYILLSSELYWTHNGPMGFILNTQWTNGVYDIHFSVCTVMILLFSSIIFFVCCPFGVPGNTLSKDFPLFAPFLLLTLTWG